jgi:hypothetical protein
MVLAVRQVTLLKTAALLFCPPLRRRKESIAARNSSFDHS